MGVLSIILLVLFVIVCLLLIFLVAIQDEKSQGLGGIFGGSSTSVFGSGTSSFINRATTGLVIAFMVLALLIGFTNRSKTSNTLLDAAASQSVTTTSNWYEDTSAEVEPVVE